MADAWKGLAMRHHKGLHPCGFSFLPRPRVGALPGSQPLHAELSGGPCRGQTVGLRGDSGLTVPSLNLTHCVTAGNPQFTCF